MFRQRTSAVAVGLMLLTAGAPIGATSGVAGHADVRLRAASMVPVSIDRAGAVSMPAVLAPGVSTLKITTTGRNPSLQVVGLAPGYTIAQAETDAEKGLDKGRIKALKRFEANVTLLGGTSAARDKAGKLSLDLEPGTYYAVSDTTGAPWTQFTVAGVDTGAAMPADATVTAVDSTTWSKRPAAIGRSGWLRFKNRTDQNHFVLMAKLLPGKSLGDFEAWMEEESGPPPFDPRFGIESGVLSPGHVMAVKYWMPRGNYVLACFWPDASMGGMPHVAMGMYRTVKVR